MPRRRSNAAAYTSDTAPAGSPTDGLYRSAIEWGEGIIGQVAADGILILSNRPATHPSFDPEVDVGDDLDVVVRPELRPKPKCDNILAVPVHAGGGEVVAVIALLDKKLGGFGPTDTNLLRQVAGTSPHRIPPQHPHPSHRPNHPNPPLPLHSRATTHPATPAPLMQDSRRKRLCATWSSTLCVARR